MEENLWWKTTFGGRQPSVEDNLQWKRTLSGRQTLVEDDLWWKMTFGGRKPLVEDALRWKTTKESPLGDNIKAFGEVTVNYVYTVPFIY